MVEVRWTTSRLKQGVVVVAAVPPRIDVLPLSPARLYNDALGNGCPPQSGEGVGG